MLVREAGSGDIRAYGGATYSATTDNRILINAATEGGLVGFYIPSEWNRVEDLVWLFNSTANGLVNVTLTIVVWRCVAGPVWGVNLNTIQITCDAITPTAPCYTYNLAPYATLLPGDLVFLGAVHRVAGGGGIATDIEFVGAWATGS